MPRSMGLHTNLTVVQKLQQLNWGLVLLITVLALCGFAALYSAAGGSLTPYAQKQMVRFVMCMAGMAVIALIDIKWWYKLSYFFYGAGLVLLVIVELMGQVGMGAQRWINLGFMTLQPSELMKIAVIMALARYFYSSSLDDMKRVTFLLPPALLVLVPFGLVMLQPDLGTALMIVLAAGAVFWLAGAPWWLFAGVAAMAAVSIPVAWQFILHDYQKQRVLTFLDPERDPLGAGYHIMQSKIALGSGGIGGKGYLQGSQSHLNFLPEKQTDFIFTLWAEEWGLLGGLFLLLLFGGIFLYCGWIALRCRYGYGRILAYGLMVNFSLYVFINIGMVMGLLPVVGAPLPLISYGGTAMLAALISFGLILSCSIHRDAKLKRM